MDISLDHQLCGLRLMLRRLTPADAPAVHAILADWRVARMLRRATFPLTPDQTASWLSQHEREWRSGRAYRFAVLLDNQVVGCPDIADIDGGVGELGYWFDPAFWGQGFAGEAARLVRDFARDVLALRGLRAGHAIENAASGRILLRLGFKPTRDDVIDYPLRREKLPYRRYVVGGA